jgi:GH25 family lysozyme M1 (1,4-beta-N-acetylmuramidase)
MAITYGVDVSYHQSDRENKWASLVNWKKLYDDGARFVILRASIGVGMDVGFENHLKAARDAGFEAIGAYHYLYWDVPVEKQVESFMKVVAGTGIQRGFCDVEHQMTTGQPGSSVTSVMVNKWQTYVWGNMALAPSIYTRRNIWERFGSKADWVKLYDLWAAWYGWTPIYTMDMSKEFQYRFERTMIPKPWERWTFCQFSDKGAGYVGKASTIDFDAFNGSEAECLAWFGVKQASENGEIPADALARLWAAHPELH